MSESSPTRMAHVRVTGIAHSDGSCPSHRPLADSDGSCPSCRRLGWLVSEYRRVDADSDGSCPSHRRLEPGRLPVPGSAPALPAIHTTVTVTVTVTQAVTDRLSSWCAVTPDSGPLPRPCPPLPRPVLKVPCAWRQWRPMPPI